MAPRTKNDAQTPDQIVEKGDRVTVKGVEMEARHVTEHELILVPVKIKKAA